MQTSTSGVPLRVFHEGRNWHVGAEPIRWFERVPWWRVEKRMARESATRIDVKVWRLQVRLGGNRSSALVTWEVVCEAGTGRWWLRSENGQPS
ncbi:hypothetical protein CIK75_00060 [Glutamicibacter sp. BW78]|nr:hypothetical protein CIK75_00060 [Glutamicibacter sp. BW78]